MTSFVFPRSGELHNLSSLSVPEPVLSSLVLSAARDWHTHPCPRGGCPHCRTFLDQWWLAFSLLSQNEQTWVDAALLIEGIPHPTGWA